MFGRNGLPPTARETSIGVGNLRGVALATGMTDGPDLVARVMDALECVVEEDGNGCSVYFTRLRGKAAGESRVGTDILGQRARQGPK